MDDEASHVMRELRERTAGGPAGVTPVPDPDRAPDRAPDVAPEAERASVEAPPARPIPSTPAVYPPRPAEAATAMVQDRAAAAGAGPASRNAITPLGVPVAIAAGASNAAAGHLRTERPPTGHGLVLPPAGEGSPNEMQTSSSSPDPPRTQVPPVASASPGAWTRRTAWASLMTRSPWLGSWTWTDARALLRRAAIYLALSFAAWCGYVLVSIVVYRTVDPPTSNLMMFNRLSGEVVVQKWVPIDAVPAQLIRAIVVSEDGRFCSHRGIDFREIEAAIERARDGMPRGASTITMQVAKNLYLWPAKSYIRKALELPITLLLELFWTKRRIFEVYVNIAEWGPGVFGAEAAAGYHFGKGANRLSEREAALLAVALPNPVSRDAGDPGPGTERLAATIQARMRAMSRAASCIERRPRA